MKYQFNSAVIDLSVAIAALSFLTWALLIDEEAANAVPPQVDCCNCHVVEKKSLGSAYKDLVAKYPDTANAEAKLIEHTTIGKKTKCEDSHEKGHKIINTKDMNEIRNLVNWFL